jgi:hypothetical protein
MRLERCRYTNRFGLLLVAITTLYKERVTVGLFSLNDQLETTSAPDILYLCGI